LKFIYAEEIHIIQIFRSLETSHKETTLFYWNS